MPRRWRQETSLSRLKIIKDNSLFASQSSRQVNCWALKWKTEYLLYINRLIAQFFAEFYSFDLRRWHNQNTFYMRYQFGVISKQTRGFAAGNDKKGWKEIWIVENRRFSCKTRMHLSWRFGLESVEDEREPLWYWKQEIGLWFQRRWVIEWLTGTLQEKNQLAPETFANVASIDSYSKCAPVERLISQHIL